MVPQHQRSSSMKYTSLFSSNQFSSDYNKEEKEELFGMLRYILGSVVILSTSLSQYSLSKLLHLSQEEVEQTLDDLHAILEVAKDQTRRVRLHHPSFRDFLLDKNRCDDSDFWVDEKQAHQLLARNCIKLLSTTLKEDICGVTKPGTFVTDIKSSQIEQCLPPEVQYACLYWVGHLQKGGAQLRDHDYVDQFLRTHFLHWLEALSWIQKLPEGISEIISLQSIVPAADCADLHAFIQDMKRFVLHNQAVLKRAPLQVYCGALLFAPGTSLVRRQFTHRMPRWIKRRPKVEVNWSATLQVLEGHSSGFYTVAFSPEGKQLASGSEDSTIRVWDAITGAILQILEGHSEMVSAVAFSPDGKHLASGSHDKTLRVWNAATGVALHVFNGHGTAVSGVDFSPDGKYLASSSYDETVRVWDAATGATLQIFSGHWAAVSAVTFSPDGKHAASSSYDKTVLVWDVATGATAKIYQGHLSSVYTVAFSPDGKRLASGSCDATVRIWDVATGATLQIFEAHVSGFYTVAFSPDGKQLASGLSNTRVRIWDVATGATLQLFSGHSATVFAVVFSPDGKLLASCSSDRMVRVWDVSTKTASLFSWSHIGHSDAVNAIAFSPDSKQLASGSDDTTVHIRDTATEAILQILHGHLAAIRAVAFSPGGTQLVSGSTDMTVRIWDVATGTMLHVYKSHTGAVVAVAFSPDDKQLVSSSSDKTARVWDLATGSVLEIYDVWIIVKDLWYSGDGSIMTDRGRLHVTGSGDEVIPHSIPSPAPFGPQIFALDDWIGYGDDRILLLPLEYRPSCSGARENIVCLGHKSGRVSIIEFLFPL